MTETADLDNLTESQARTLLHAIQREGNGLISGHLRDHMMECRELFVVVRDRLPWDWVKRWPETETREPW